MKTKIINRLWLLALLMLPAIVCLAQGETPDSIVGITGGAEAVAPMPEGFWGTMTPYWIIIILLVVATIACYIRWSKMLKYVAVVGIPAMLLVAAWMELVLFSKLGKDNIVWWCDMDKVGFLSSFLRLFPFALILMLQVHSFFAYQNFIFGPQLMNEPGASISLKPKAKGFWWLLLVVVAAGVADRMGLKGSTLNIVVGLLTVLVLFFIFGRRNIDLFGFGWGVAVTFFAIVYIIALLLVAYAFFMVLIKLVWQMIVWAFIGFAAIWVRVHIYNDQYFAEQEERSKKRQEEEWRKKVNRGEY